MRTWKVELFVVAVVLSCVAVVSGKGLVEWVGSAAVLLSFAHAQVADRLAEREAFREKPTVECHRLATRYFVSKEILWCAYFLTHKSWSALVGVALFLAYPAWRKLWRARRPVVR